LSSLPPPPPSYRKRRVLLRLVAVVALLANLHGYLLDLLLDLRPTSQLLLEILDTVLSGFQSAVETLDLSLQVVGSVTIFEDTADVFTSRYALLVGLLVKLVEEVLSQSDGYVLHGELNTR
jgi:hypothetical protein